MIFDQKFSPLVQKILDRVVEYCRNSDDLLHPRTRQWARWLAEQTGSSEEEQLLAMFSYRHNGIMMSQSEYFSYQKSNPSFAKIIHLENKDIDTNQKRPSHAQLRDTLDALIQKFNEEKYEFHQIQYISIQDLRSYNLAHQCGLYSLNCSFEPVIQSNRTFEPFFILNIEKKRYSGVAALGYLRIIRR